MKKIALISAIDKEFNILKNKYNFKEMAEGLTARLDDKVLILVHCGIAKVNAAVAADRLCRSGVDLVMSLGGAGGIDPSLARGDTVISTRVCYHDVWCGEPCVLGQIQNLPLYFETPILQQMPTGNKTIKKGLIVTGDQFVTETDKLDQIKRNFPEALALDMESAAIAQVCFMNKTPCVSVRIISDVIGAPTQVEAYQRFWTELPDRLASQTDACLRYL